MTFAVRKLIARAAAAAVLLGIVLAAAAFPSHETTSLTPESLLAELRVHGMEFQYEGYARGQPFVQTNGFVHREGVTGKFVWGEESLWVHEFAGPGEALVAATRIDKNGGSYLMPTHIHGQWVGGGGYGIKGPVYYFLRGNIIAKHVGDSEEVPAVLEELMGEPFAGSPYWNREAEPEERLPAVASLWQEQAIETEFVSAENFGGRSHGLSYRIKYRAYYAHSFACSGSFAYDRDTEGMKVAGNEIYLTLLQRTVDTDVIEMSAPCDLEWQWAENSAVVHGLAPGQTYKVFINDEQAAEFTAEE